MTVLDTTDQESLHRECELHVPGSLRVARYTQLAVLKGFRGLGIPLRLMLEAREQVIRPGKFDLTWLLYAARYTENCSFQRGTRISGTARDYSDTARSVSSAVKSGNQFRIVTRHGSLTKTITRIT